MKLLKDPNNTRFRADLPLPIQVPPKSDAIFKPGGYIDWIFLKKLLENQGKINDKDFQKLIKIATRIFRSEPNLISLKDPVTIVGDIHGQFYDFIKILESDLGGCPDSTKYVFLGDYVDRGYFSIEVLILILALKISHSSSLIMLRGNHQCRQLTSQFNFRQQCLKKYNQNIYDLIMELFDALPLACLINGKFLCVHGGISHQIKNLQDIQRLNRFIQIPKSGIFCDLVWSDPIDPNYYTEGSFDSLVIPNTVRNCSYYFGYQLSRKFLDHNKLLSIIRAHEAQAQGYKLYKWKCYQNFPSVVTIFSAPNYCDYYKNKGAIIKILNNALNIKQYKESPHPCVLPKFLDLFSWSLPFIFQKVTEMLYHLIQPNRNNFQNDQQVYIELLYKKKLVEMILAQSRKSTKEKIGLVKLNGNCPDDKLLNTGKYLQTAQQTFEYKRLIDQQNQSRP